MKVVVIDDDPTGSQTVHSCPLLLHWDVEDLLVGLRHPSPLLFLLADTRALTEEAAGERNREIAANLDVALSAMGLQRSDVLVGVVVTPPFAAMGFWSLPFSRSASDPLMPLSTYRLFWRVGAPP